MDHQQAIQYSIKSINERIEAMGAKARAAKEEGDDDTNAAARNFQNGLIECADLLEKMLMLVDMTGGKPSKEIPA